MKKKSLLTILLLAAIVSVNNLFGQNRSAGELPPTVKGDLIVTGELDNMDLGYLTKWTVLGVDRHTIGNSILYDAGSSIIVDPSCLNPFQNKLNVTGRVTLRNRLYFESSIAEIVWGDGSNLPEKLVFFARPPTSSNSRLLGGVQMVLDPVSGNVGIGTENPTTLLEIFDDNPVFKINRYSDFQEFNNLIIGLSNGQNNIAPGSNYGDAVFQVTNETGHAGMVFNINDNLNDGTGYIKFNDNENQNTLTILNNGKVGIKNEEPTYDFDVKGTTKSTDLIVNERTTTTYFTLFDELNPPQSNFILKSDIEGKATWCDPMEFSLWKLKESSTDLYYTDGNVGIGTINTYGYRLAVDGKILTDEVMIEDPANWYDCVFEPEYELRSIKNLESFIKKNKHLPDVPSEADVMENGYGLADMNSILLKKVEELTLYIIEQQKAIESQQGLIEEQHSIIKEQQVEIDEIKNLINSK